MGRASHSLFLSVCLYLSLFFFPAYCSLTPILSVQFHPGSKKGHCRIQDGGERQSPWLSLSSFLPDLKESFLSL